MRTRGQPFRKAKLVWVTDAAVKERFISATVGNFSARARRPRTPRPPRAGQQLAQRRARVRTLHTCPNLRFGLRIPATQTSLCGSLCVTAAAAAARVHQQQW